MKIVSAYLIASAQRIIGTAFSVRIRRLASFCSKSFLLGTLYDKSQPIFLDGEQIKVSGVYLFHHARIFLQGSHILVDSNHKSSIRKLLFYPINPKLLYEPLFLFHFLYILYHIFFKKSNFTLRLDYFHHNPQLPAFSSPKVYNLQIHYNYHLSNGVSPYCEFQLSTKGNYNEFYFLNTDEDYRNKDAHHHHNKLLWQYAVFAQLYGMKHLC